MTDAEATGIFILSVMIGVSLFALLIATASRDVLLGFCGLSGFFFSVIIFLAAYIFPADPAAVLNTICCIALLIMLLSIILFSFQLVMRKLKCRKEVSPEEQK